MKTNIFTVVVIVPALALSSCANLQDDAFAHAVKSGNARAAVSNIQPGQARLRITERDGRTYYPIHYALVRGDAATAFTLLRNGSPTVLDGRSLAFNAARVKQPAVARELAAAGYGTRSDIAEAEAAIRRQERESSQSLAIGTAIGVVALLALMSADSGPSSSEQQSFDPTSAGIENNRRNYEQGLPPANSAYPGYGP